MHCLFKISAIVELRGITRMNEPQNLYSPYDDTVTRARHRRPSEMGAFIKYLTQSKERYTSEVD